MALDTVRMIFRAISFFFNDTATTEIYTLSLHDALPIWPPPRLSRRRERRGAVRRTGHPGRVDEDRVGVRLPGDDRGARSEEHTSELQSRQYLVCRLLLEKNNREDEKLWYRGGTREDYLR